MTVGHYGVVSGGVIANIILLDPAVVAMTLPTGSVLTSALDGLSPLPQIGWNAAETGGVWSFTPPAAAAATLTPAQQQAVALASGVAVTSASNAALNGTYPIDANAQQRIYAVQTRINAGLGLPFGASTITWYDTSGGAHSFTAAQFTNLAGQLLDYIYAWALYVGGTNPSPPSTPVTIA